MERKEKVQKGFNSQAFMQLIGAELTDVKDGYCEIVVPFKESLTQNHNLFHGGLVGTLADNASGFAAYSVMEGDEQPLTAEYKINLIAKASGKRLVAQGSVIKAGRNLKVCESKVYSEAEDGTRTLCAVALVTIATVKIG